MWVAITEVDVPWEPSRDPSLGARPCAPVPSLFSLSVKLLVNHINAVTSLWGVPDPIRSQLAAAVCAQRKLSPEVALLFGQDTTTELVIPDCSQLDAKAMAGLLQMLLLGGTPGSDDGSLPAAAGTASAEAGAESVSPAAAAAAAAATAARLERLELGSCGRGFDDKAAALVASAGPLDGLRVCRLTGAYRLGDSGLLQLLGAAPGVLELAVPSAPRLTGMHSTGCLWHRRPEIPAPVITVVTAKHTCLLYVIACVSLAQLPQLMPNWALCVSPQDAL